VIAILGEDASDTDTVKVIVRRLLPAGGVKVKGHGYSGGAQLLRKGAGQFALFKDLGYQRFIVCHDADKSTAAERFAEILERVVRPSTVTESACIVIPVEEIEAWILADLQKVRAIFTGWKPTQEYSKPESVADPKEELERISRVHAKPRYIHAVHNQKVAEHLDLDVVARKCPSFVPLRDFIVNGISNCA